MVFTDFLTETRRKWLQAFKVFNSKNKKSKNRVSPDTNRCSSTVDACNVDIGFCGCRKSLPPLHILEQSETTSDYQSSCASYDSNQASLRSYARSVSNTDSAYDSFRSSPAQASPYLAAVTYLNVNDSEDSSSIDTEYTLLDNDEDIEDEDIQNMINESIELGGTL